MGLKTLAGAAVCLATLGILAGSASAAEPYKIHVIAPTTGGGAFLGKGEEATMEVFKDVINKDGGINVRPL